MRDYKLETEKRVGFIRGAVKAAGADGIVFGNSGGKDSALVGILCKTACDDTVGLIMPCGTARNYESDWADAEKTAERYKIETRIVDISKVKDGICGAVEKTTKISAPALANIAPRLRMTAVYTVANSENRLVAGTGNRSEGYMGYFTKWGDGAYDFNPIADLTVTEIYEYLRYLGAPDSIISKAPSAGLFDGQTDEGEMGVTYKNIDEFLFTGEANEHDRKIIERFHGASEHKRGMPLVYEG
jgi:NAD+ synthase